MTPWPAPAKLNRFLHITGRREDGYHDLQTVFQFLDVGDELAFAVRDDGRIALTGHIDGVAEEDNLVVRAARRLREYAGIGSGADITLRKHLPVGAGLGGGSSDCATTLVALNALWGAGLEVDALAALGLELGADVPVFVRGYAAWAEGVGDRLEPVAIDEPVFLVVTPPVHVSTRAVFEAVDLTRNSAPITIRAFLSGQGGNDCEAVVRKVYPQVDDAFRWFAREGLAPRMTGTGSSVFVSFESAGQADAVRDLLPPELPGFVARGLNRSPLLARLEAQTGGAGH